MTVNGEGRVPPQAVEVEKAILGAMLLDREAVPKAIEVLRPEHFYSPANLKIFKAMNALFDRSEPIDIITVADELRRAKAYDEQRDAIYLTELTMGVTTAANVEHHAMIVLNKALKRNLITSASNFVTRAYSEGEDALDLLDEAENTIFQISEQRMHRSFTKLGPALHETIEQLQAIHGKHGGITGVPSGFPKLDDRTGGFQKSDLVIVAGRPSQGKTAFALTIARNAALHRERKTSVGIFSLEMSQHQLVVRLLASEAKVNAHELRTGRLHEDRWKNLSRNIGRLADANIFIDDTPALGILELRAKARRLKAEHDVGLIVVDYLQLVQGPKNAESREREISMISRSLKALAKDLNVPVMALSQVNRAVEARADKRPALADLRECVTGDTLVCLADGRKVPIASLAGSSCEVFTMSPAGEIVTSFCDAVWPVGRRPVVKIDLEDGRSIRATEEHRLLGSPPGLSPAWMKVKDLRPGDLLAVAAAVAVAAGYQEMDPDEGTEPAGRREPAPWPPREVESARIVSMTPAGTEEVYDLTVPGTGCWLADGIVSHNSGAIEQDADVVIFIHRPESYGILELKDDEYGSISSEGVAEIIIGKQRNGPTDVVRLAFRKDYAGFEKLAPMGVEAPPALPVGEGVAF